MSGSFLGTENGREQRERGGPALTVLMFQAYIYVGNIYLYLPNIRWVVYMLHTGKYTWSCYFLLLHLD